MVVLRPNKADLGSPALGQGVVYRLKVILRNGMLGDYLMPCFLYETDDHFHDYLCWWFAVY